MKMLGVSATWFENQQKYEVKKTKKINDKLIMKELLLTNQEIKLRRKERLLELYSFEYELYIFYILYFMKFLNRYEKELSDKGLAIIKERY
jgi:hypothetical protein